MNPDTPLILHHYEASPYAEKIRLLLGQGKLAWQSVLSPPMPPRPNLDPLVGGYRRIPVVQIGADLFCDSHLIADEIALLAGQVSLASGSIPEEVADLVARAEGDVFFAAITGTPPFKLMLTMLRQFGPVGTYRFIKDRSKMMQGGATRPPQGEAAVALFDTFLSDLDEVLASREYLSGKNPGYADFAVFHPLWLRCNVSGRGLDDDYANVQAWYARIEAVGHGARQELEAAAAFAAARAAQPRALPESESFPIVLNTMVHVGPVDYGLDPVAGKLVAVTADRFIVARDTDQFGLLHVHFPRQGYQVVAL